MSYLESLPVIAGADFSSGDAQFKAVAVAGTIAASGSAAFGILQNKPKANEDATLGVQGRSRFKAGAAVAAGALLTVTTSGWFITATSGTNVVGRNGSTAAGSGGTQEGLFNFATPGVGVVA